MVFANDFTSSMLFMKPSLAKENILMRSKQSLSLSPLIAFISLNEKGEKGPGADLWILVKIPAQMMVGFFLAKVTSPIPTSSHVKPPMRFVVVEREDFFTQFSWLVAIRCRCILNHVLDGEVEVFGPVLFHLFGLLFPLIFRKSFFLFSLHISLLLFVAWMSCQMTLLFTSIP
jgi:hypothetical protein